MWTNFQDFLTPFPPCGLTWTIWKPPSPLQVHVVYEWPLGVLNNRSSQDKPSLFLEAFFSILPMHKGWSLWNHWICIDPSPMGSTRQSKWAGWPSEMLTSLILLMKLGGLPSPSSAIISCSALLNLFSSKFLMESVPVLKLLGNWGSVTMFCLLLTWTLQLT